VPVAWDDEVEAILGADLTAALGYRTPAAGAVVVAVAPIGLHDRAAGTVGFTTSLAFGNKLARIADDPRVALAFHAREHGASANPSYVLVHGRARVLHNPSAEQQARMETLAAAFLGPRRTGVFWDRWLREYYDVRVQVHVDVDRIVVWPDLRCAGPARVLGAALPEDPPQPQRPPRKGTGPRLDAQRAGRRVRGTAHALLGFAGADGYPQIVPVDVEREDPDGLALSAATALPPGGRRAALLGHSYRPKLIGLETRQYTGWLDVGEDGRALYAPHTEHGYKAPANKTLLLFLNGLLAKRGVRKRRRAGTLAAG
jgi:hypothetical protein